MTPLKILFLDIDGPMVPARTAFLPGNGFQKFGWHFDQNAVGMLNFLNWTVPNLRLVISSHRWGAGLKSPFPEFANTDSREFWQKVLDENNIKIPLHADWLTPREMIDAFYRKQPKAIEINNWLQQHSDIKTWVTAEDDLNGGDAVTTADRKHFNLIGEDYNNGITWDDFRMMVRKFGVSNETFKDRTREYSALPK